jgi:hypothetical protein
VFVERVGVQRREATVGVSQVGGDDVGVQLRIAGAREPVPIRRGDEPLAGDALGAAVAAPGEARLAL